MTLVVGSDLESGGTTTAPKGGVRDPCSKIHEIPLDKEKGGSTQEWVASLID
eukprot:CAMPEP_0195021458 /NCGR_PEP_ID=MMETSP0326_2-20130528/37962_1 /TAXON_ID=2866 ORGANISM="Crypthecodinium cohnii, Strain Seligo" /NCGR_SAMPLE_ID=MMETSP0326_2 /ASSEMBLY_ACC=CAM_ASM_000348 /LENGTH=51 /DNA_ID=CAMNT_0040040669 /DNA_START=150 /DNA_END=305 /DNA_ORIENTATION=-